MLLLALDTSAAASAALLDGDTLIGRFASADTRSHAEVLAPAVQDLLRDAGVAGPDLGAIAAGVGPGPFTGLRAGLATARTLAFVWGVPLHGVMSLDALAFEAASDPAAEGEFLVATDARRREVYWARYRGPETPHGLPVLVDGPHVGPAAQLPELPVFGAGAGLYREELNAVDAFSTALPHAAALGRTASARLAAGMPLLDTTPLYLRESDAKVPGARKKVGS
ncbi:tRNA (adenosine(37)-N6)-threonylcarbamoyltransferase complex dimerization subunit type 1 TsaB [Arthrobacter frigidicola]|nr:tRNA (adenosine(37)-N6)-threonylcarbamoyltransferase complex dimerization subunit type 1 TsaB [Arthrobacter frigidicola]